MKTDHSETITDLRKRESNTTQDALIDFLCADLLELHDRTSLSLDNWVSAKQLIKMRTGVSVQPNGA